MSNLAELIEQYLRRMLMQQKIVELQRRELARMFRCAPSQINYVLETRFTFEKGYIIESKRGGGGYIRITRIQWPTEESLPELMEQFVPDELSEDDALMILQELVERKMINLQDAQLAGKLMDREFSDLPDEYADSLRARFLKALLLMMGSKE